MLKVRNWLNSVYYFFITIVYFDIVSKKVRMNILSLLPLQKNQGGSGFYILKEFDIMFFIRDYRFRHHFVRKIGEQKRNKSYIIKKERNYENRYCYFQ